MIVPNNAKALGDFPTFTAYRCKFNERRSNVREISGLGYLLVDGDKKLRDFKIDRQPKIKTDDDALTVSFSRTIPNIATQQIGYCALPSGAVVVFSQWRAISDIKVAELVDHPFYWNVIPGYLPTRTATAAGKGIWSIDGKLQMQVIGRSRRQG